MKPFNAMTWSEQYRTHSAFCKYLREVEMKRIIPLWNEYVKEVGLPDDEIVCGATGLDDLDCPIVIPRLATHLARTNAEIYCEFVSEE